MGRDKIAEWWYALTIQRRGEILAKHGSTSDPKCTYSKLEPYAKESVMREFEFAVVDGYN